MEPIAQNRNRNSCFGTYYTGTDICFSLILWFLHH